MYGNVNNICGSHRAVTDIGYDLKVSVGLPVEMHFYISVMFLSLPDDIHDE